MKKYAFKDIIQELLEDLILKMNKFNEIKC